MLKYIKLMFKIHNDIRISPHQVLGMCDFCGYFLYEENFHEYFLYVF